MIQNDRISLGENCIKISICERKYDQNEQGGKVLFGRPKHILRCLTNRVFMLRWTQFSKVGQHYSTKHEKLINGGS